MRYSRSKLMVLSCVTIAAVATANLAYSQEKPDVKPAITVIAPPTDEIFNDLKLALDLAGDDKGFETLKDTIETFLVGIDTVERGGVRIYPTASGLQMVITLPIAVADPLKYDVNGKRLLAAEIKKLWPTLDKMKADEKQHLREAELKKRTPAQILKLRDASYAEMISNLWDLDVKTAPAPSDAKSAPAPSPTLDRQIPKSVKDKVKTLKLAANERLIFGLMDGFLSYESGHVHLGTKLEDVRLAKGGLPTELVKGNDLAVFIDGKAQTKEERQTAFDKAKQELVGAITKGEKESEAVFEIRKALTEHQIAEIERFFVEASRIHIGWNVSAEKKHARLEIELEGLAGTALDQSVDLVGSIPDEFAGVSKQGTVFNFSGTFPLDPLRQNFGTSMAKLGRTQMKKEVADDPNLSAELKKVDDELTDLLFDVVDGIPALGFLNGFACCWANGDGTLTSVAAWQAPPVTRVKVMDFLEKTAARVPANKLEKLDSEEEVEIHKLTVPEIHQESPEFIDKDGIVYVGLTDKTVWVATGDKSLDRLKTAIKEAKSAGPKASPGVDLFLKFAPFVEAREKHHQRNPVVAAKPVAVVNKPKEAGGKTEKSKDDGKTEKKAVAKVEGLISGADLRKIALETFKDDKDTMTMSLVREGKVCKVQVQFDEALIRYVGKLIAKVVKENLADE
jgi:hypothetical protein